MKGLLIFTLVITPAAFASGLSHYVGKGNCQIEFDYPSDWNVTMDKANLDHNVCAADVLPNDVVVRANAMHFDKSEFEISVEFYNRSFLQVASMNGFDFDNGNWVIIGRQGMTSDASVITTPFESGVEGTAEVGCFYTDEYQGGGYAGLCDSQGAILRNDQFSSWSISAGSQVEEKTFETILKSLHAPNQ